MPPLDISVKEFDNKFVDLIGKYMSEVRNGRLPDSINVTLKMLTILEMIINELQDATFYSLCAVVREAGRRVSKALPYVPAAANMARRVLRAIHDEYHASAYQRAETSVESLQRLVLAASSRCATLDRQHEDLRDPLRNYLSDLRIEVKSSTAGICGVAGEHVHADEIILTYGANALTERFLRAAAPRRFRLILIEGSYLRESHAMANRLSTAGVPVTVVSNAATYAVMYRVNKIVLSVSAVLGGGAILAPVGASAVTDAAKHYGVPVLALAPLHTLCPIHAPDLEHSLTSPEHTMDYERHHSSIVNTLHPLYDFVSPNHITLFITNLGGSSPSYMYRILSELYDASDNKP